MSKGAHYLACGLLLIASTAWAQVSRSPVKDLPPPGGGRLLGALPKDAAPPSANAHDLNGVYMMDRSGPMPGAPSPVSTQNKTAEDSPQPPVTNSMADSYARCVPEIQAGSSGYTDQIIQTPGRITFIAEYNHVVRRIYLDETFPEKIEPSYTGYSIGHWQDDTLVVETRGLKSPNYAKSPDLASITRVVERIRKKDGGMIVENSATVEGFDHAGKPLTVTTSGNLSWRSDLHLIEFICEDGADLFFTK